MIALARRAQRAVERHWQTVLVWVLLGVAAGLVVFALGSAASKDTERAAALATLALCCLTGAYVNHTGSRALLVAKTMPAFGASYAHDFARALVETVPEEVKALLG